VQRIAIWFAIAVAFFAAGVATTAATDSVDWDEQQWGNAAEWAAGIGTVLTLLLGLAILARDHANAERAQVDLVGAWAELRYDTQGFDKPRDGQASILINVRNASQLPITVTQLAYSIRTQWLVPEDQTQPKTRRSSSTVWRAPVRSVTSLMASWLSLASGGTCLTRSTSPTTRHMVPQNSTSPTLSGVRLIGF
jgi:hypothetical protein